MTRHGFDWSKVEIGWFEFVLLLSVVCADVNFLRKFVRHALSARKFRQGPAAELATAQCLSQVMIEGGLDFHDIPGEGFNIDHVVIGKGAVLAVETRSRKKPASAGK
ncbi:MAG: NERD domain-containing protein [Rhizobium sp.]|nr:NERD domain-containing protein [Rhizobium sp.]